MSSTERFRGVFLTGAETSAVASSTDSSTVFFSFSFEEALANFRAFNRVCSKLSKSSMFVELNPQDLPSTKTLAQTPFREMFEKSSTTPFLTVQVVIFRC